MNPLLRKSILTEGLLTYATPRTNALLLEKDYETVDRIAKEILFLCLGATINLNLLSEKYLIKNRLTRLAQIPKELLNQMNEGAGVIERGFMSASAPGGGFAGGGPSNQESCRVKFLISHQSGKQVNEFSDLPENEVLFRPFTKFKVLSKTGSEESSFRIELQEILPNEES